MKNTLNELKSLNSKELLQATKQAAKNEQNATFVLLAHLYEVNQRRLYAELRYSSINEYVMEELHYSDSAASERCRAMHIVFNEPVIKERVLNENLCFTSAAKIHSFMRAERKRKGRDMTEEEKSNLFDRCKGKSSRDLNKVFVSISPLYKPKEKEKPISEDETAVSFILDAEMIEDLKRYRELHGYESCKDVFKKVLHKEIQRTDPILKKAKKTAHQEPSSSPAAAPAQEKVGNFSSEKNPRTEIRAPGFKSLHSQPGFSSYKNTSTKAYLHKRAESQCEFVAENGERCACKTRLQVDHIVPLALGGDSSLENLRLLCPEHNRLAAIHAFGTEKMSAYLKT